MPVPYRLRLLRVLVSLFAITPGINTAAIRQINAKVKTRRNAVPPLFFSFVSCSYSLMFFPYIGSIYSVVVRMQILEQILQTPGVVFKIGAKISPGEKRVSGLVFSQDQFKNPVRKSLFTEFYFEGNVNHFFILSHGIGCNNSNLG